MNSLKEYSKPQCQPTTGKLKSKKPPPLLLNLDAEDGEEEYIIPNEDDNEGLTKKEAAFHEALVKKYSDCKRCGEEVRCKINRHGFHSRLTFGQINAWAVALVCR